jgi:CubicO group peptidase (beta-lactamase class C family)
VEIEGGARAAGRRRLLVGGLSAAGMALGGCGAKRLIASAAPQRGPGRGPWRTAAPADHGLSLQALDRAADSLGAAGERQGLVVIRGGQLVYERYFANEWHRADAHWRNVSFSSGKSWGATMVGRAVTQGRLKLDDLASDYHPAHVSGLQPQTTIRHLLTMTSGGTLNVKPSSRPPRRLDQPTVPGPGVDYEWQAKGEPGSPEGYGRSIDPGTTFYYDGAAADHLADIVAAAVGETSHAYMMREVVAALGCEDFAYQSEGIDPRGNIRIGGSITLSCRDMARLGQLYLDKGRWSGRQLIDPAFIEAAWTPSALNPSYGFLWWLNTTGRTPLAPRTMAFAAGARGQFCFVLPEQDLVVATMGFGRQQLTADAAWAALAPALL